MQLITGSRNYSSWTMRAWLAMRLFDIPFIEVKIALNKPDTARMIALYSPSGRIPCLLLDQQAIWDSLSICEFLAEKFPQKHLWPVDNFRRAHARSVCAEMHSEYSLFRHMLRLDVCRRDPDTGEKAMGMPKIKLEADRVESMMKDCLARYGGPFLFKELSIADAYLAPMLLRFRTYGLLHSSLSVRTYANRILDLAPLKEWIASAADEMQTN